jgi:hypothetical protein
MIALKAVRQAVASAAWLSSTAHAVSRHRGWIYLMLKTRGKPPELCLVPTVEVAAENRGCACHSR